MSEALRQVVWKCDRCGGDAQAIFGIFPSCKCGSTSFKAAQPPAPTAQPAPMSQPNRLIAYSAAAKLREIGYVWDEKSGKWEAAQPVLDCEIQPRPLPYPLTDYHRAGIDGPLHYTWQDKPHRLLYDLIAAVRYYAAPKEQPHE